MSGKLGTRTGALVTDDDVRAYGRDGAVCLRRVFDRAWVERLLVAVDRAMANPGRWAVEATSPGQPGRFHMNSFMWRWDAAMRALALDSPMIDVAARLLCPERLTFFYDHLLVKEPGTRDITRWHQDLPYWPVIGEEIVSIWLALTPVTDETGGVQYVAGSHRWNRFFRAVTPKDDPSYVNLSLERCPDYFDPEIRRQHRILSWSMQPGDVICHHPLVIHGASGNATQESRRIGICLRYASGEARWDPRPYTMRFDGEPQNSLKPGDPLLLDGVFPVVWDRSQAASATSPQRSPPKI